MALVTERNSQQKYMIFSDIALLTGARMIIQAPSGTTAILQNAYGDKQFTLNFVNSTGLDLEFYDSTTALHPRCFSEDYLHDATGTYIELENASGDTGMFKVDILIVS